MRHALCISLYQSKIMTVHTSEKQIIGRIPTCKLTSPFLECQCRKWRQPQRRRRRRITDRRHRQSSSTASSSRAQRRRRDGEWARRRAPRRIEGVWGTSSNSSRRCKNQRGRATGHSSSNLNVVQLTSRTRCSFPFRVRQARTGFRCDKRCVQIPESFGSTNGVWFYDQSISVKAIFVRRVINESLVA